MNHYSPFCYQCKIRLSGYGLDYLSGILIFLALLINCSSQESKTISPQPNTAQIIPPPADPVKNQGSTEKESGEKKTSTSVDLGLSFAEGSINLVQGNLLENKKSLSNLWINNTHNYAVMSDSSDDPDINNVIDDFEQCGFDYAGPSCIEGQQKQEIASGMFAVGEQKFSFFSFSYDSESEKSYVLLFPLLEDLGVFPETHAVYLYLLNDRLKAHSAEDIFTLKSATPIATFHYSKLSRTSFPIIFSPEMTARQKLRLLHYKTELEKLFNEPYQKNIPLEDLRARLNEIGLNQNDINEQNDHNAALLLIMLHKKSLSPDIYTGYLATLSQSKRPVSAMEIQINLALIRQGETTRERLEVLNTAFTKGNRDLVRIAFWSLNFLDSIPLATRNSLVKLLGETRSLVVKKVSQILIKYGIDPSTVPLITGVMATKSRQESTVSASLDILGTSSLPEVNRELLTLLENDNLREKIRLFLLARPVEEELLPELAKLFTSTHANVQYLGLELVNRLESEAATLVLIENSLLENDFRFAIVNKMVHRTNFSDLHVDALIALLGSHFDNLPGIAIDKLLIIKTPRAANPLIDRLYSDKDPAVRDKIMKGLYKFTFSEINLNPLKYRYYPKDERFQAALDYLMMIPGDIDATSEVVINYIRSASNDDQIKQIFSYLDSRKLEGNCAIVLAGFFDYPKPETEYFVEKSKEYISRIYVKEAQIALAAIMGKPTEEFRLWAIHELEQREIDPSIGKTFATYITGELYWPDYGGYDGSSVQRVGRTNYPETLEAAKRFFLQSKSPEGAKKILYELSNREYASYNVIREKDRDAFAEILKKYFISISPGPLPETVLTEVIDVIKRVYGDEYGRIHILKLLPLVPSSEILDALEKEIDKAKDKDNPVIKVMVDVAEKIRS